MDNTITIALPARPEPKPPTTGEKARLFHLSRKALFTTEELTVDEAEELLALDAKINLGQPPHRHPDDPNPPELGSLDSMELVCDIGGEHGTVVMGVVGDICPAPDEAG